MYGKHTGLSEQITNPFGEREKTDSFNAKNDRGSPNTHKSIKYPAFPYIPPDDFQR